MQMLPDVNDVYPQLEPKPVMKCNNDRCDTDLFKGDEVIGSDGYHYCSEICVTRQMLKEGHAIKIVIGR